MHVSIHATIYVLKEIQAIQNNMLLRVKSAICNVLCHPGKKMLFGVIYNQEKIMCNISEKIVKDFYAYHMYKIFCEYVIDLFIYIFKTTTITYNARHSKFVVGDEGS